MMNEQEKFITDEIDKSSDTPKVSWLSISSKFAGICVECNGEINQGESILWCKGKGAKHNTCPAHSDDSSNDNGIVVIDDTKPKVWNDSKKYSYKELLHINECQCCGADVSDRSKRYIDDDRLICVQHFGK